jgi:ATP-dependent DNA helicase DinG
VLADDEPGARSLLAAVVAHAGGQHRQGQEEMCAAVASALHHRQHLIVEAPTGIGKSYALAVAAADWLEARRNDDDADPPNGSDDTDPDDSPSPPRVVIATATKALQDQLVDIDLPTVSAATQQHGAGFTFAVLKGRSNYLCLSRAAEATSSLLADDRDLATAMVAAAERADDGERSRLPDTDDANWRMLSVTAEECPGARSCSFGEQCWAEAARARCTAADVVVVNSALYAAHLLSEGAILVDHDAVVVDEAHALADVLIDAASVRVSSGRLRAIERTTRLWGGNGAGDRLLRAADGLRTVLEGRESELDPTTGDLAVYLADARAAARDIARAATTDPSPPKAIRSRAKAGATSGAKAATKSGSKTGGKAGATSGAASTGTATAGDPAGTDPALQAASAANHLADDLALLLEGDDLDRVVWSDGDGHLQCAPIEADELGRRRLWPGRTVVCTSATLRGADASGRPSFAPVLASLGAPARTRTLAVDSPFDHRTQGLLYVPKGRIPSPRQTGWADGVANELAGLATAAGGRTLALFTSRAATESAAAALRAHFSGPNAGTGAGIEVFTQWDAPRQRLVDAMIQRRRVVVCATRSFWTGIDIPGDACVVVAIDRIPFPRPDDPLMAARRRAAEARGDDPFLTVDVPAAAIQLAQGVGRLIRSGSDRGVVAVLDTRLATARWRRHILAALPDLRRSIDPAEAAALLSEA